MLMVTVTNRTETSARIKHAFESCQIEVPERCDLKKTLQIDTKVLASAEAKGVALDPRLEEDNEERGPRRNKKQQAEFLRQQVNTVSTEGGLGEQIQHVISVQMLSEG